MEALGASEWREWMEDKEASSAIWDAVLAHHGNLPDPISARCDESLWSQRNGYDPLDSIGQLWNQMAIMFPQRLEASGAPALPSQPRFLHAFAGLVTLSDWLGSDETVFAFPDASTPSSAGRIAWSRSQAAELVRNRWLDPTLARTAAGAMTLTFGDLFPKLGVPRPAQEALLSRALPSPGQITVIEAETGSGKTEAALIHFLRLFQVGEVDGLYFALPTRAAAVQIHGRISKMLAGWFKGAAPPVGLAVPGYLRVDDRHGTKLPDSHGILWPDDEDRDRTWAVENAKRYLSGAVMVGTIDQLLLGGVRVRHAQFRSGPMLRLMLCIDEVHASDEYMAGLLRNILDQHARAGGHALLMSATLGTLTRMRLLQPSGRIERALEPSIEDATSLPYPAIERSGEEPRRLVGDDRQKRVSVELVDPEADFLGLLDRLRAAADAGAAVLFIRNRVDDAQRTVQDLERLGSHLLTCAGIAAPHHSRFAAADRHLLDQALEASFAPEHRAGVIAVTTQTAEQSLDICADWLVTDIAPGDVLLQRIGRLHRHQYRRRPRGFESPCVTVLAPTAARLGDTVDHKTGRPRGRSILGLGRVYKNLVGIQATREWLDMHAEINVPADNRALVEAATHSRWLEDVAERLGGAWPTHLHAVQGGSLAAAGTAQQAKLKWDEPLSENQPGQDEHIQTRLGLNDRAVPFQPAVKGPFGQQVATLNIPGWMAENMDDSVEPEDIQACDGGFLFRLGEAFFRYDRLGLRKADDWI